MAHYFSGRAGATLLGAIGIMLWATETTLITYTIAIPPLQTVALAFFFAAAMTPIVWWLTGSDPLEAFRQPPRVWLLTVGSLVGYHACIYYATQKAPPAAAALLQGTTPLMIVVGSALIPGERLRWWHVTGALLGLVGVLMLVDLGSEAVYSGENAWFYLTVIGIAAALWGIYSLLSRALPEVPTTALGVFYAAASFLSLAVHFSFEEWVEPQASEWLAVAALGILPMGLAIYLWDFGLKRGDIQALGAFSYVEPFVGAVLVAIFTTASLDLSLVWSGLLVVGGAVIASASLWKHKHPSQARRGQSPNGPASSILGALALVNSARDLSHVSNQILSRLMEIGSDFDPPRKHDEEMKQLLTALRVSVELWDELGNADAPVETNLEKPVLLAR